MAAAPHFKTPWLSALTLKFAGWTMEGYVFGLKLLIPLIASTFRRKRNEQQPEPGRCTGDVEHLVSKEGAYYRERLQIAAARKKALERFVRDYPNERGGPLLDSAQIDSIVRNGMGCLSVVELNSLLRPGNHTEAMIQLLIRNFAISHVAEILVIYCGLASITYDGSISDITSRLMSFIERGGTA
jgi:hypothetical protein